MLYEILKINITVRINIILMKYSFQTPSFQMYQTSLIYVVNYTEIIFSDSFEKDL